MRSENYSFANLRGVSPDFLANKLKSTSPNERMMLSKKTRNNTHSKTQIKAGKMKTITSQDDLNSDPEKQVQNTMT